jgi:hypothetical protein
MKQSTVRSILRWIHLVSTIPVLGYVYGPPAEVEQYVNGPRYLFVPLLILTGYWMYAGASFAVVGAVAWLGASYLSGFGGALLGQIALLIAWKAWRKIRARSSRGSGDSKNDVAMT